jgi:N-methylhydantoinase A
LSLSSPTFEMRISVDTGGTFTDLVVEDPPGQLRIFKSSTTPDNPVSGVMNVLDVAAGEMQMSRADLLGSVDLFIHGTTRAINAILTGVTARTALLVTKGHSDILLFREGGRTDLFSKTDSYPEPYIPRRLTYEIYERIRADGKIIAPLNEGAVVELCDRLRDTDVEAIAVCLLWSIVNPAHELRIGELLNGHLPNVPYTLSHELNPIIREYRRASSTAIDASLKPVMTEYLKRLGFELTQSGFRGRLLVGTSGGGVLDAHDVARAPIHSIGSGPAMAPIAGRHFADVDTSATSAVIADAGGTSYDVSLVRKGKIPWTREAWIGRPYFGHMTGFPAVDVKSVGAGGGSIAWIDEGGLLRVGPKSAGAIPGPACYSRGGVHPTVTDACLALGYLDPEYFLGGAIRLNPAAALEALARGVGDPLSLTMKEAAAGVLTLATENMVRAIEEITLNQGIDPREAVLVGGGGASGLNAVAIAARLGCRQVVIPEVSAALSAVGALLSDLTSDFSVTHFTTSADFDIKMVNSILRSLEQRCCEFFESTSVAWVESTIEYSVDARYPSQVWELEVPLVTSQFVDAHDIEGLKHRFHAVHREIFAIDDPSSEIEIVGWRARARIRLREEQAITLHDESRGSARNSRPTHFDGYGDVDSAVVPFGAMPDAVKGPALIESPVTTVVIPPGYEAVRSRNGSVVIDVGQQAQAPAESAESGHQDVRVVS